MAPNAIQRARLAWKFFRQGGQPRHAKKVPFAWPSWTDGKPQWHLYDFQTFVEEGFNLNAIIYEAIMFKARQIGMAPLRAYTGDPEKPDLASPDHRTSRLCFRPNPHQSFMEFQWQNTAYLNLAGNVYILLDRPKPSEYPQAMYSMRPDRVKIIPRGNGIGGYAYFPDESAQTEAIPIPAENVMHIKLPHPLDPYEGMGEGLSPIAPMAHSADVDNAVTKLLKNFFDRGTQAFGFIELEESMDDTMLARLRDQWDELYGGSENWGRPVFLDSGAKWNKGGTNFAEMGFDEIDERNETRILGPFGVPPILIGSRIGLKRATYANYQEARRACWEDTLNPELDLYEVDFQYYLNDGDVFVRHDKSKVPALRADYKAMAEAAEIMIRNGVPPNTAFRLVGIDAGDIEGGDISYFPMTLAPLTMSGASLLPEPETETNEGAPEATEEQARQAAARLALENVKKNRSLSIGKQSRPTG